jgi:hypothetical protein
MRARGNAQLAFSPEPKSTEAGMEKDHRYFFFAAEIKQVGMKLSQVPYIVCLALATGTTFACGARPNLGETWLGLGKKGKSQRDANGE